MLTHLRANTQLPHPLPTWQTTKDRTSASRPKDVHKLHHQTTKAAMQLSL